MASKTLYVGNLPYDATEDELRNLFEEWGPVGDVRVIGGKGFGFVDLPEENSANAIAGANGKDFKGRALTVNEARPRGERGGGGGGGGRGGRGGFGGGGGGGRGGGGGGRGGRRW